MKLRTAFFVLIFAAPTVLAQMYSSVAEVITVFSQNEQFYLVSTPYDNASPSLPGVTKVYKKGIVTPLYEITRGFDSVDDDSNNLVLSNDGSIIMFILSWRAEDEIDGLKSVSIYRQGKLIKSYTTSEITGCDLRKERCELVYSNFDEVVDSEKSHVGTRNYKKAFKSGVNDAEKFLSDFPIFANDDSVYLTDSKKTLHRFSLSEARLVDSVSFPTAYERIKTLGRFNKVQFRRFDVPMYPEFPRLRSGVAANIALGRAIGMKPYDIYAKTDEKYKRYSVSLSGFLNRDGSFDVTEIDTSNLPKEQIQEFFAESRFAVTLIPKLVDKWLISEKILFFRKANTNIAMQERLDEIREEREVHKKNLVAETIGGRYIPKNLDDAFIQLDKELPEVTRAEMTALKSRKDMIAYHLGLGTWMRNNWGLWGGSRLQKYFTGKGVTHPEEMSSIILFLYWDWLRDKKEIGKEWEKNPKSMFDEK